jgi:hypothetical protein
MDVEYDLLEITELLFILRYLFLYTFSFIYYYFRNARFNFD